MNDSTETTPDQSITTTSQKKPVTKTAVKKTTATQATQATKVIKATKTAGAASSKPAPKNSVKAKSKDSSAPPSNVTEIAKVRKTRSKDSYASQAGISRDKFRRKTVSNDIKGAALINALYVAMQSKEHTPYDLAQELDITYSYLMSLSRGDRSCSGLENKTLRKAAAYLNMTTAQASLMAEAMEPEDFYLVANTATRIEAVYQALKTDPLFGGFAVKPDVWEKLHPKARLLIAVLYENGAKTKFLDVAKMVKIVPAASSASPSSENQP